MKYLSTKNKVTFGYVALIILILGAIFYLRYELNLFTFNDSKARELRVRRQTTNDIIYHLYQAEVIAQSLNVGKTEQYADYTEIMKDAYAVIDSLYEMSNDSIQMMRIDTIRTLLKEKDINLKLILTTFSDDRDGIEETYKQEIEKIVANKDSVSDVPYIRHKTITHTNSYNTPSRRKGFFRRLAEVFVPAHEDSVVISDEMTEEYVDTLYARYTPADSIVNLLKGIHENIEETAKARQLKKSKMLQTLQVSGLELSRKINALLHAIESEEQAIIKEQTEKQESIRRDSAKTLVWISVAAVLLAAVFLFLILKDITRSNHYKKNLEQAKEKAEVLLAEREKLMLAITHDIKAPVGSIIGYIDLLKRIISDERQNVYVSNMEHSAKHLLSLVTSLLEYHRLDVNKKEKNMVAFNPHEMFDAVYTGFLPCAEKKELHLSYSCTDELDGIYMGDPFSIRQIIDNLMSNALKFTDEGGVTLSASVENECLHISVCDTGCGIPQEECQQIFKEFTRLYNAQGQEGFGLGLSITMKLVDLLDGEIKVDSRPGEGSCFYVSIPLRRQAMQQAPSGIVIEESSCKAPDRVVSAIIIDDDRIQLQLTAAMLDGCPGISATCCEHPEELFRKMQEKMFDIILTDIQMPAMNGFELLDKVNASDVGWQKIPVVAVTARSDMDEGFLRSKGFAGSINKPFTRRELLDIIHRVCKVNMPDFSAITAFAADDEEAAKDIMQTFISETENNLSLMRKMEAEDNLSAIASIAHKMLPIFVMLKVPQCTDLLKQLERMEPELKSADEIKALVDSVIAECSLIMQQAHQFKIHIE